MMFSRSLNETEAGRISDTGSSNPATTADTDQRRATMDIDEAISFASTRKHATLITIRSDGRPQSSDIVYAVDDNEFIISITDDRAKTINMRRDPRVVLHLSEPASWSYLSFDGTVELTEATTSPSDETSDALVAYFETINGSPHPDWADYRQAMIDEQRLIARFKPTSAVGQTN